jgi:flagellar hook-length control protein FliK
MADFPIELSSYMRATGPTPATVSIANIAIERRFREHLDEIESRAPESTIGRSSNSSFDPAETDHTDSLGNMQHDSVTEALHGKALDDSQDVSDRGADAGANPEADDGPYVNVAASSGRAASGDTKPHGESVRPKAVGKAQPKTKPGSEDQEQEVQGVGVEQGTEQQDFGLPPAAADVDTRDDRLSNKAPSNEPTEALGIRVRSQGGDSRKSSAEKVANEIETGEAMEVTGSQDLPLEDDAEPAARPLKRSHAKLTSNIQATTSVEAVSATTESVSPETGLITQVGMMDPSGDDGKSNKHISRPPSDVLPDITGAQNDREIAAPTLLSSRLNEPGETQTHRDGLNDVERVRLVQRVARAFHSVGDEGGEVQLRLRPPELGSLRMEIAVRDGVMTAKLETETAAARNILLDNLPQLRERLAEQNVKVERFDVNVRDEARQRNDQTYEGQPNLPRSPRRGSRPVDRSARPVPSAHAIGARTGRGEDFENLNVVI